MKYETPIISLVMPEKCSSGGDGAKKNSITKGIYSIQKHAARRMQGGTQEEVTSFPLRPTLEPAEELPDPIANWVVP